jgi:hypothetical protein
MPPFRSKQIDYMEECLRLAQTAPTEYRSLLIHMAKTFALGATQINKSVAAIADSRELLSRAEQGVPHKESRAAASQDQQAMVARHLAQADRYVEQGKRIVERQRELVQRMEHDGHDTEAA